MDKHINGKQMSIMKESGGAPEGGEGTKSLQIKPGNTVNGNTANKETKISTINKKRGKKTPKTLLNANTVRIN